VRFDATRREAWDDGWGADEEAEAAAPATQLIRDPTRRLITRNDSPDIPFEQSINPYRGCEHGCIYCYARPSHAYLGYSPGLEFETRLLYKPDAPVLLRRELAHPGYRCRPIMLGSNTDVYQPAERRLRITRGLLEVFRDTSHPLLTVTKSALIERDLDLWAALATQGLAQVTISLTSLDARLSRRLEPRAPSPERRLQTIARLAEAGIPVGVLVAPLIPVLTDPELEAILAAAQAAGARSAGYVLLRLPLETAELFGEWLERYYPGQQGHILARVRDCHGGKEYDPRFGRRMTGAGLFADLYAQRFRLAARRLGFVTPAPLRCDRFRPPPRDERQLSLF